MVKVLVVDDSAVMRQFLTSILETDPNILVVGSAMDSFIAAKKITKLKPDVITLDIEMPKMDGLTFLSKLMISNPLPVIMVSVYTDVGVDKTIKSLQLGAVDTLLKPMMDSEEDKEKFKKKIIEKIYLASVCKIKKKSPIQSFVSKKLSADVILKKQSVGIRKKNSEKIISIGASTGGTVVIENILYELSGDLPAILIAQHMPENFTLAFAERIDKFSDLNVKEASHGDRVFRGVVYIAPGGKHMLLRNDNDGYWLEINEGPLVNRHKPSVDVLFRSVSQVAGSASLGILCTGMGDDGAKGLLEMKNSGAVTIAQNEDSCVVFGMPNEAIKLGGATYVYDVDNIIKYIRGFDKNE